MLQSELLYKAAAIMRERGMCRFELEDDDFRVCAMGALNLADHGTYRYVHGYYDSDAVLNAANYVAGFCGWVKPPPLRLRPWDIYEILVAVNNDNSATTERMASLFELAADQCRVDELAGGAGASAVARSPDQPESSLVGLLRAARKPFRVAPDSWASLHLVVDDLNASLLESTKALSTLVQVYEIANIKEIENADA